MIKALFKVCAPLPRSVGASRLEEDPTREGRLSILVRPELDLGVAPQPAPRTSLLQSKNSYTGSVGCLASSPRETWTSPKSFRSFLEQREAALARRSRGPSLGSIHEGSWSGTQDCRRPPNDQETNKGRNESDSKYRVLEQKVIELEDQVEEMQMSRWDLVQSYTNIYNTLTGGTTKTQLHDWPDSSLALLLSSALLARMVQQQSGGAGGKRRRRRMGGSVILLCPPGRCVGDKIS